MSVDITARIGLGIILEKNQFDKIENILDEESNIEQFWVDNYDENSPVFLGYVLNSVEQGWYKTFGKETINQEKLNELIELIDQINFTLGINLTIAQYLINQLH